MLSLAGINWIAVLVGVVFSNGLGFLWYGPLFSKPWLKALGKTEAEVQGSPSMYIVTLVTSFITMVVLAMAVGAFGAGGLVAGALLGLVLYVGFLGTSSYVSTLFEQRSNTLWWINGLYNLVIFVVMGAVFAVWA
jgi:hypothetical protein